MLSMKLFSTPLGQLLDRARGRRRLRGVVETARLEANAVATVVESLALSRPEVGFFLRSECRRRKTKDAHDEDHAQLHP
jgi:hypothetical protein